MFAEFLEVNHQVSWEILIRKVGFSKNETPARVSTLFFEMPIHPFQMKSYDEEHAF
jgi:hypothetical protein